MNRSSMAAVAAVLGFCLAGPSAFAEDAPPAPPGGATAPATQPGAAPGTTRTVQPAPPSVLPGVRTVMVFPFEPAAMAPQGSTVDLRALGRAVADFVRKGLENSGVYSTVTYDPDSVLIERARQENSRAITPDLLATVVNPTTGAVDPSKAMTIAQSCGMQALMLGSIEDYKYDKGTNKVEIVGSAQILNAQTGEPLRNAAVSGTFTGAAGADEISVAQSAATDLANRLLAGLSVPVKTQQMLRVRHKPPKHVLTQEEEGSRRHRVPGWLPAGILMGILFATVK